MIIMDSEDEGSSLSVDSFDFEKQFIIYNQ
jgi:hypothetical protein